MPAARPTAFTAATRSPAPRYRDQISATMTTNPPPSARNARIYTDMANVALMDILSGREQAGQLAARVVAGVVECQTSGPKAARPG